MASAYSLPLPRGAFDVRGSALASRRAAIASALMLLAAAGVAIALALPRSETAPSHTTFVTPAATAPVPR